MGGAFKRYLVQYCTHYCVVNDYISGNVLVTGKLQLSFARKEGSMFCIFLYFSGGGGWEVPSVLYDIRTVLYCTV